MKKVWILVLIIVLFSSFVFAGDLEVYEAKCFKDGSAEITVRSNNREDKIYTEDVEFGAEYLTLYGTKTKNFDLTGSWENNKKSFKAGLDSSKEFGVFKTDEALFRDIGDYIINMKYSIENDTKQYDNFEFVCAGMIFSCSLINIEVEECKTIDNKKFETVLDIKGLNQSEISSLDLYSDIGYSLKAENKYEDIKGEYSETGSLPKGFDVKQEGSKYHISYEFEDNFIYSVVAKFHGLSECKDTKKYPNISLYNYKECELFENKIDEEIPEAEEKLVDEENKSDDKIIVGEEVDREEGKNWLIGILVVIIVFLVVILIIMKKQKANKEWI